MKKAIFLSLVLMLSIALAGSASATHFENLVLNADCRGWSATGGVITSHDSVEIRYMVELLDGTTLIEQYSASKIFILSDLTFNYGEIWTSELCGEYTVNGVFELIRIGRDLADKKEFTTSFTCECQSPDTCTGTPGYWKNHPDAWPVEELTIGGSPFDKDYLLDIFNTPMNLDKRLKLFHHLVAAKLNVLRGASYEGINDAITAADDFFAMSPLGTKLDKTARKMIDGLKAPLEEFNESSPCGEEIIDSSEPVNFMLGASPDENQEEMSWGAVKSIFKK